MQEEIFGPVLVATPYSDIDEVAKLANSTAFGLGASIWSRDLSLITKMARRVRSGMIWVNWRLAIDAQVPWAASSSPATDESRAPKG